MEQRRDGGRERPQACHCQGGRLTIIIGRGTDPSIRAALDWAATSALAPYQGPRRNAAQCPARQRMHRPHGQGRQPDCLSYPSFFVRFRAGEGWLWVESKDCNGSICDK